VRPEVLQQGGVGWRGIFHLGGENIYGSKSNKNNDYNEGYGQDNRWVGVRVPVVKNSHFSVSSRQALGSPHPPIQ
jgi:hypothetical protein